MKYRCLDGVDGLSIWTANVVPADEILYDVRISDINTVTARKIQPNDLILFVDGTVWKSEGKQWIDGDSGEEFVTVSRTGISLKGADGTNISAVTPEMFGAIGNGSDDDSDALSLCFSHGKIVILNNSYLISDEITVNNNIYVVGSGKIIVSNGGRIAFNQDATIENIGVVGNNITASAMMLFSGENVNLRNVSATSEIVFSGHNGITFFNFSKCKVANIDGIVIEDIKGTGDGTVANANGNVTALYFNDCAKVSINKCNAQNIHNVDENGAIIFEDSNCIYVAGNESRLVVTNSSMINCGKRAIKTQCSQITVDNCYFYNDKSDCLSLVGILAPTDITPNAFISNCKFVNGYNATATYCLTYQGTLKCSNCEFTAAVNSMLLSGNGKFSNCDIGGSAVIQSDSVVNQFYGCKIDKTTTNNQVRTDLVEYYDCEVNTSLGRCNAYNSKIKSLNLEVLTYSGEYIHRFVNCYINDNNFSRITHKAMLKDCIIGSASGVGSLRIANDCEIDGLSTTETDSAKYIIDLYAGNLSIKNVDLKKNRLVRSNGATSVVTVYPSACDGKPEWNYGFEGAVIFNIQDRKYYKYAYPDWVLADTES